jgi:hypothetical protein
LALRPGHRPEHDRGQHGRAEKYDRSDDESTMQTKTS